MAPEPEVEVAAEREPGGWRAEVTIRLGGRTTRHRVRVPEAHFRRLAAGRAGPEELVRASFEFLLEREPPECILPAFVITAIGRYFPEYERAMANRFGSPGA